MKHDSTIVHIFDEDATARLRAEINLIKSLDLWTSHFEGEYAKTGALRHGKTFWLRKIDHNMNLMVDRYFEFPESYKLLKQFSKDCEIGRSYWHWLRPGDSIDKHNDRNLGFTDQVLHRYQVYTDIPDGSIISIDEGRFDPITLKNCVLDFNMHYDHFYRNDTDSDLIFMVFDVFKPGVHINNV